MEDNFLSQVICSPSREDELYRDDIRKIKMQLQLNLARDAKNHEKGFYRCVSKRKKVK